MPYVFFYCIIMLRVFRSNHHCSWKFHKFHRKTPVMQSFLKSCRPPGLFHVCFSLYLIIHLIFLLIDWCHKRLKNTIDLLLFYREHFYGFSMKMSEKKFTSQQIYLYRRVTDIFKFYGVLFCTYCKDLFCLQKTVIMLIFLRICIKHSQH